MTHDSRLNGGDDPLDPARLERLLEDVARLPREIDPQADAWPAIRQRIEAQRVRSISAGAGVASPARSRPRWWIAAAAAVVIAVGTMISLANRGEAPQDQQVTRDAVTPPNLLPPVAGGTPIVPVGENLAQANPSLAAVLDQYHQASRELEAEVAGRTAGLSPATREVVRRSLATIDTAIADLRAALGANPRDAAAGQAISTVYERKLEFLKRVRALPAVGM
jgi:hypothetical protein